MSDEVRISGWLVKRGQIVKNWRKRWVVVTGRQLMYFEDPPAGPGSLGRKLRGSLRLMGAAVEGGSFFGRNHTISITSTTDGRDMYMQADNEEMMIKWVRELRFAAQGALSMMPGMASSAGSGSFSSSALAGGNGGSSASSAGGGSHARPLARSQTHAPALVTTSYDQAAAAAVSSTIRLLQQLLPAGSASPLLQSLGGGTVDADELVDIVGRVRRIPLRGQRLAFLHKATKGYELSSEHVAVLLHCLDFDCDRLEALDILLPITSTESLLHSGRLVYEAFSVRRDDALVHIQRRCRDFVLLDEQHFSAIATVSETQSPMPLAEFEELVFDLAAKASFDERTEFLERFAARRQFDCQQLLALVKGCTESAERVAVLRHVAPRVIDVHNYMVVVNALFLEDERRLVQALLCGGDYDDGDAGDVTASGSSGAPSSLAASTSAAGVQAQ